MPVGSKVGSELAVLSPGSKCLPKSRGSRARTRSMASCRTVQQAPEALLAGLSLQPSEEPLNKTTPGGTTKNTAKASQNGAENTPQDPSPTLQAGLQAGLSAVPSPIEEFLEKVKQRPRLGTMRDEFLRYSQQEFYNIWEGPRRPVSKQKESLPGMFLAVDCEMISTVRDNNAVARVAVVNEYGYVLLDTYVEPGSPVKSYRTRWSGVSKSVLQQARLNNNMMGKHRVVAVLKDLFSGKIVVGHAVSGDMKSLGLQNSETIRTLDTQKLPRFKSRQGLRNLLAHYFQFNIQGGDRGHNPVEDAQASMLLFRTFRDEFNALYQLHTP